MRTKQHWPPVPSLWQEVSAAPAICNGRLHGILCWDKGSVTLGSEAFFTEVHHYARWIMKTINTHWGTLFLCPQGNIFMISVLNSQLSWPFLFLDRIQIENIQLKKKKGTKNSCFDRQSLYTLTASMMRNVATCLSSVHPFQKVLSCQLLSRHCIC